MLNHLLSVVELVNIFRRHQTSFIPAVQQRRQS